MIRHVLCLALLANICSGIAAAEPNFNLSLDRPHTMRGTDPFPLEGEKARQIRSGDALSSILPRPCFSELDSSRVCGNSHGFAYRESARARALSVSPLLGYEYRFLRGNVNAFELGLVTTGSSGPVSFYLDARMFTELHEDAFLPSYDREFVERQDESASGTISYSSYSRYRSTLAYDLPWARFSAGRDVAHWGPGIFGNLSLNQGSLPFNQVSWLSHLGPISVISLYAPLTIHADTLGSFRKNPDTRALYAHRYEWRATRNLLLGISEQLIVYNWEEPFALIPAVPLFILKGTGFEERNNGNISADIAYRMAGSAQIYSEFFLDDLQSPTSLFDDYWGNRWAWMFGIHGVQALSWGLAGLVAEYSRIEPWVYTHYHARTAQTAHGGYPLGNPQGPNSQWIVLKLYVRGNQGWYGSTRLDLIWKGKDAGSSLSDTGAVETDPKAFIRGVGRPLLEFAPYVGYNWNFIYLESMAKLTRKSEILFRIHWQY